jgi:membrane fusion protein
MGDGTELFRREALHAQTKHLIGEVVLYRPLSFAWLTLVSLVFAAAIIAFLVLASYTRKEVATGYLTPSKGKVRVLTPLVGKITERRVAEGAQVRAGDVLFVVSAERESLEGGATLEAAAAELQNRRTSLVGEKEKQLALAKMNEAALISRREKVGLELQQLRDEIATQRERVHRSEEQLERFKSLAAQGFISAAQVTQREDEKLEQVRLLQSSQRAALALEREMATLKQEIPLQHLRADAQIAGLDRALAMAGQEAATFESQRAVAVTSPVDGVATAILAEVGQPAAPGATLATVLPAGADLEAHLLVSSRAIGFLAVGQTVRLRYAAFRFERFGHYKGVVTSISKTTVNPQELPAQIAASEMREPRYRITVKLEQQSIQAYGKDYPLVAGMQLDADIQIEHRKLYQLILDPLYSMARRV